MRRTLIAFILLSAGATAYGQSKSVGFNFSGTWQRDDTASAVKYSYPFGVKCEPPTLEIVHRDSELMIASITNCHSVAKGVYDLRERKTYYTDERGEFNDLTGASTTKVEGRKIVTTFTAAKNGRDTKWLQIYEISKKLDKITVRMGPKDDPISNYMIEVYRKQVKF